MKPRSTQVTFSEAQLEYLESIYAEQYDNATPNELYIRLGNRQVINSIRNLTDTSRVISRRVGGNA